MACPALSLDFSPTSSGSTTQEVEQKPLFNYYKPQLPENALQMPAQRQNI